MAPSLEAWSNIVGRSDSREASLARFAPLADVSPSDSGAGLAGLLSRMIGAGDGAGGAKSVNSVGSSGNGERGDPEA